MKRKYVIRHMALLLSIFMLSSPPCSVLQTVNLCLRNGYREYRRDRREQSTGGRTAHRDNGSGNRRDMTEDEPILSGTQDTDESMIYGLFDGQFSESDKLQSILDKGQAYLKSVLKNPVIGTTGGEWSVIAWRDAGIWMMK